MNLPILSTAARTMSSREIAELTGKDISNVHRDIRQMLIGLYGDEYVAKIVPEQYRNRHSEFIRENADAIFSAITGDDSNWNHHEKRGFSWVRDKRGYITSFSLDYSHTMALVSGYNVKLRKAIIDRWMELERAAAQPKIPKTLPEALRLAADLAERVEQQQVRLTVAEPKAAGFDRITQSQGELCLRDAAKTLGIPERKFTQWLIDRRWIYRDQSQTLRPYADRVRSGHLAERISTPRQTVQGEKVFAQTIVTPAGLARLGAMAERQGKLTVVGGVA